MRVTESRCLLLWASCRRAFLLAGVLAMGLPAAPTAAQRTTVISGQVVNESGAPVAGAFVTLRETRVGVAHTSYSNAQGRYALAGVPPGVYEVTAKKEPCAGRTVTPSNPSPGS